MKLILYRGLFGLAIAGLLVFWGSPSPYPDAGRMLWLIAGVYLVLLIAQGMLYRRGRLREAPGLLLQFGSDVLIASLLIYATHGLESPFPFLLGLIVMVSGAQGRVMMPVVVSILACVGYLAAVYAYAWGHHAPLDAAGGLHVLLQVSAVLLAGGVMAFIARRHAGLSSAGALALRQHRRLKGLHARVMSAMREGVIVLDGRLQAFEMNAAAKKLLAAGETDNGVLVERLLSVVPELKRWLTKGGGRDFYTEIIHGGRNLLITAKAMGEEAGGPEEPTWLLTLVDLTEVRKLEQQLIEREKMALLGRMSAMLAHEIRNPIQTMAQGLELMNADAEHRDVIYGILRDEMLRLDRLVNMMLQYSRPLQPHPKAVRIRDVIAAAARQVDLEAEVVRWRCDVERLCIDPDHFRLVLDNLLSNAVKNRAPQSQVEVSLSAVEDGWRLRVCNRGTLAPEVRQGLFDAYVSGGAGGIGLGLAIVKQVCDANGWAIEIEESHGRVCFVVTGREGLEEAKENGRHG